MRSIDAMMQSSSSSSSSSGNNLTLESLLYDEFSNREHDFDDGNGSDGSGSPARRRIKCLHRSASCISKTCERVEECTDATLNTDCFVVMREMYEPDSSSDQQWLNYVAKNGECFV